jgi:hypothetical protein
MGRVPRWLLLGLPTILFAAVLGGIIGVWSGQILLTVQTPGSQSVRLTVASRDGPLDARNIEILASPSLAELSALVVSTGGDTNACGQDNCWPHVSPSQRSLFIALEAPVPCRKSALSAEVGPGKLLTIQLAVGAWVCPPGAGTLAVPNFWLLTVPIDALPRGRLAVSLNSSTHVLGAVGGEPLDLPSGETLVELRQ